MLSHTNVLIIGGDVRQLEIINQLSDRGIKSNLIGFEEITFDNANVIQSPHIDYSQIDAILLPVAGTDEAGKVDAVYSDNDIHFTKEILMKTPDHCKVYTGTAGAYLENLTKKYNRSLIKIFSRDDTAVLNSIPTAEGALMLAMENTNVTIHDSNVLVLGFGRVGMTVARLFSSVGANVTVCVRNPVDMARIKEMGLKPLNIKHLKDQVPNLEICINTIPHLVIDNDVLLAMSKSTLIIDITSSPGGTDFKVAEKEGIVALHALGIPGKVAPKSAGKIIADVFLDLLTET